MATIVAIGGATTRGGYMTNGETRPMDEAAIEQTGEQTPNVLFLPTARGDPQEYQDRFHSYFEGALGCNTKVLELVNRSLDEANSTAKIEWADAVYVGGGATSYMLNVWRNRGIDTLLHEAWQDGTVMFGISAGALCWTDGGLQRGTSLPDTDYGPLAGLEFVEDLPLTVHATPEIRSRFTDFLRARGKNGVALENNAAIEITDGGWRIITSEPDASAHHIKVTGQAISTEVLPEEGRLRPLSELRN